MDYFETKKGNVETVISSILEKNDIETMKIIKSLCNSLTCFLQVNDIKNIKTIKDFIDEKCKNAGVKNENIKNDLIFSVAFICEVQKRLSEFCDRFTE